MRPLAVQYSLFAEIPAVEIREPRAKALRPEPAPAPRPEPTRAERLTVPLPLPPVMPLGLTVRCDFCGAIEGIACLWLSAVSWPDAWVHAARLEKLTKARRELAEQQGWIDVLLRLLRHGPVTACEVVSKTGGLVHRNGWVEAIQTLRIAGVITIEGDEMRLRAPPPKDEVSGMGPGQ